MRIIQQNKTTNKTKQIKEPQINQPSNQLAQQQQSEEPPQSISAHSTAQPIYILHIYRLNYQHHNQQHIQQDNHHYSPQQNKPKSHSTQNLSGLPIELVWRITQNIYDIKQAPNALYGKSVALAKDGNMLFVTSEFETSIYF